MCGICGVVAPVTSRLRIDADLITRMRDVMRHRGPDGAGIHLAEGVGLGHRRLSIIDVAHGQQPMFSDDQSAVLVYNGEIFNHPDLMRTLEDQGQHYRTRCDTETVLRLYARDDVDAPRAMRGMFAFAIWNHARRELLLARDRFGVKPLYYVHRDDGALFFASEIKSLLAGGAASATLNMAAFPDYLANHAPSGTETLFAGVRRLPAGHTLVWRDGRVTISRYWDLYDTPAEMTDRGDRAVVDEYRERLREAVRLRLMSDVPLGMFLSGGIDSAAITALMSTLVRDPIKTFSVAFAEREANELAYARMVASRYRTDHHEVVVSPEEFFNELPSLVWHEDEPLAHPSSVALFFVSRLASQHVKVVLTGEGSDESLAGYERYRNTLIHLQAARLYNRGTPSPVRRLMRAAVGALPRGSLPQRKLSRTFLALDGDFATLYLDNFSVFSRRWQGAMLSPAIVERVRGIDPYEAINRQFAAVSDRPLLDRLLYADTKTYLHELLMKQDQMSMAASIESRVPFLDHPLAMWVAGLPARMKLRGLTTKWVLREAMRDLLPAPILSRKKMGFPVPFGTWVRGPFRWIAEEFILGPRARARGLFQPAVISELVRSHDAAEANHSERLWALVNLEIWHRVFIDGEAPGEIMRLSVGARMARAAR
jgi:asparagine synthase (glutamine-hydrolysing)